MKAQHGQPGNLNLAANNNFLKCDNSIYCYKLTKAQIRNNVSDSMIYHGVYLEYFESKGEELPEIKLSDNRFSNFDIGCRIYRIAEGTIDISDNKFSSATAASAFHDFTGTAITVQNPAVYDLQLNVQADSITGARIGIHARNILNPLIGASQANANPGNYIEFDQTSYDTNYAAIWIDGCEDALIQENIIVKTNTAAPSNGSSVWGIKVEDGLNSYIMGNSIDELNNPVYLFSDCNYTELHCNTITDTIATVYDGVYLNSAILSDQGNSTDTWDNRWYGYDVVYGVNGTASFFGWYYDSNLLEYFPNTNPFTGTDFPVSSPINDPCYLQVNFQIEQKGSLLFQNYSLAYSKNLVSQKLFNDSVIDALLLQNAFSDIDSIELSLIAQQNPIDGGLAVYKARAMLFKETYNLNSTIEFQKNNKNSEGKMELIVFPNPLERNLFCNVLVKGLNGFVLQIVDLNGEIIKSKKLAGDENLIQLSFEKYQAGIYKIQVISRNGLYSSKLILIK